MIKSMPLVSIVTIVYNGENYIEDCINSILQQTYKNIQYIIIDGGSTDSTLDIVKKYEKSIDIIVSEKDNGISDAFNKGISKCNGQIIGILNSDDLYVIDTVECAVKGYLENNCSTGVYCGDIEYFDENKSIKIAADIDQLWKFMSIYHPATFVTSDVYERIGGYSQEYRYAMDCEFIHKALHNKVPFFHINKTLAKFRLGGTSDVNFMKGLFEFHRSVKKYNYHLSAEFYLYWGILKKKALKTRFGAFLDSRRHLISWLLAGKYK